MAETPYQTYQLDPDEASIIDRYRRCSPTFREELYLLAAIVESSNRRQRRINGNGGLEVIEGWRSDETSAPRAREV